MGRKGLGVSLKSMSHPDGGGDVGELEINESSLVHQEIDLPAEWRPIATAPQDRPILCVEPRQCPYIATYDHLHGWISNFPFPRPTHWNTVVIPEVTPELARELAAFTR